MSTQPPLLSIPDRRAAGHAKRAALARRAHAEWIAPAGRADPVQALITNDDGRIAALLPLRYGRMSGDAFAFLRGAACIMAADLAHLPDTGLRTQLCGDAHLANFGAASGITGDALFDVIDFDETLPAPFEWDVKRLAASLAVAGRAQGLSDKASRALARRSVNAYRREVEVLAAVSPTDAWHAAISLDDAVENIGDRDVRKLERRRLHALVEGSRDYAQLVSTNGTLKLPERPPAIFRLGDHEQLAHAAFGAYSASLAEERRVLLQRYRLRDVAFKAVGVGSVGTFCAIGLFATADGDTLLLQLKEAQNSVLAEFAGPSAYELQGERVVVGQRIMQAEPDLFLGWARVDNRDFYVRKLKDPRLSVIGLIFEAKSLPFHARLCGRALARAHVRAGDGAIISGYLGEGDSFDEAIAHFAMEYADQTEQDFQRFTQAIADGEIEAQVEKHK